jgi:ribose transport system substrate-binding protein
MMPQFYDQLAMPELRFILSLTNADNDYQIEQAAAAEHAAKRLHVDLEIIQANNDAITQSQQLLRIIQSRSESRCDAILFEPVGGTAMVQAARAAAAAGIGWAVLNRDVEYLTEIRTAFRVPAFSVTSDHKEIGRIQGRQIARLLPSGGAVLSVQGPAESLAAKQRASGMFEAMPADVQLKITRAAWTEASAYRVVSSWLRLPTSQRCPVDLVAAQDDSMAMGARKAFQEITGESQERWSSLLFLGCDGLPNSGQAWVRKRFLAATIYSPPNAGKAIEMMVNAVQASAMPPEQTLIAPLSYPALDALAPFASGMRKFSAGV